MPYNRNHRAPWHYKEKRQLATLARQNTPLFVIAVEMGRSPAAIRKAASLFKVSLRPINQRPYNKRRR